MFIVTNLLVFWLQLLNKKENKGNESPPSESEQQYVLTPRTEEKYNKINEEFDLMIRNNNVTNVDRVRV